MTNNNTTIIRRNPSAKFGYEWVQITDGQETVIALNKKTTDDYLYLPENPFNRRLIGLNFLAKQPDEWEVTYRDAAPRTTTGTSAPRKGLEEYLEGEDRETYLRLVEKAKANRDAQKQKPKTKAELMAELEAMQALVAQLTKKEDEEA